MKTSNYFIYKGNKGVSIAGKAPNNYTGREYKKLAPSYDIWKQYQDTKDFKRYTERYYNEILSKLHPEEVINELGDDAVLLCYEKPFDFCHRRLVAKWLKDNLNYEVKEIVFNTNLECSSIGDRRFSAFYAEVEFLGIKDSIEKIYQESKRFYSAQLSFKEAKGKKPTSFKIKDEEFNVNLLSSFYRYLWILYFEQNPYYLDVIDHYDTFTDKFKGLSVNCQADVIREIKAFGINQIIKEIKPFTNILKAKGLI